MERRDHYASLGRHEIVGDHTFELAIRDADENVVRVKRGLFGATYGRPDEVDYVNHVIRDVKPRGADRESLQEIADFYKRLYRKAYGVTPEVEFVFYDRAKSGLR